MFDLGKQVPVNTIIDKAVEVGADAIGLSALLVSTSKQMPLCVQELDRRGIHIPVLIGGAAINRRLRTPRALRRSRARLCRSGVFYCKDVFEGSIRRWKRCKNVGGRSDFIEKNLYDAAAATISSPRTSERTCTSGTADTRRSDVSADHAVPDAPFFGVRVLDDDPS